MRVQINPFYGHTGYGDTGSMWWMVGGFLVSSFHLKPRLFDEGWVICEELLDHHSGLNRPPNSSPVEECPDIPPHGPDARLILCWVSVEGDPGVNDAPVILGYPLVSPPLGMRCLGDFLSKLQKYCIFPCKFLG